VANQDGEMTAICGASRSGKSYFIKKKIIPALPRPLFIWDYKDEYHKDGVAAKSGEVVQGAVRCTTQAEFIKAVRGGAPVVCFHGAVSDFDYFCEVCFKASKVLSRCTVLAEELASVTGTAKAVGWWGEILRMGLGMGMDIVTVAQSFTESDKTSIRNCSRMITYRQNTSDDIKSTANRMGVDPSVIATLKKYQGYCVDHNIDKKDYVKV